MTWIKPAKLLFLIALCITLAFGVWFARQAIYWNDPAHQDQTIAGWMRLGYVARSWDVPVGVLRDASGLPAAQTLGRSLSDLAQRRGVTLPVLIDDLSAAITAHRDAHESAPHGGQAGSP